MPEGIIHAEGAEDAAEKKFFCHCRTSMRLVCPGERKTWVKWDVAGILAAVPIVLSMGPSHEWSFSTR